MSCTNNGFAAGCGCGYDSCLLDSIAKNIGKIVTVFTASGGASGSGFTGLLTACDGDCIKLVTTLPAPPPYPFPECSCGSRFNLYGDMGNQGGRCRLFGCSRGRTGGAACQNPFGSCTRIPICQIVSFIAAEV